MSARRLRNQRNPNKYKQFLTDEFRFPQPVSRTDTCAESKPSYKKRCEQYEQRLQQLRYINLELNNEIKLVKSDLKKQKQKVINGENNISAPRNNIIQLKNKNTVKIEKTYTEEKGIQCNTIKNSIEDLKSEIDQLNDTIYSLNDDKETDNTNIFNARTSEKGRPYHPKLREVYYFLRSKGVSIDKIDDIVRSVLSMVDIEITELPSKSTAANLSSELGLVAKQQLNEELKDCKHLTLQRDATAKKGHHYYASQIATENKTFTVGILEVSDGTAETYVTATNEMFDSIEKENLNNTHIIKNVANFMTDRSATEEKVNKIIYKDNEITANSFKCSVHALLQFSEVSKKVIVQAERDMKIKTETDSKETVTEHLLRSVSKLFFKNGTGDPLNVPTFIIDKGIKHIPLINFRGNRFNTLFYNAAGKFYLHPLLSEYLQTTKSSMNYTEKYIWTHLQDNNILAMCRALGIVCKTITGPYWEEAEKRSALQMGPVYCCIVYMLKICEERPELLLTNSIQLLPGPKQPLDNVSKSLFDSNTKLDDTTTLVLKQLCGKLRIKCEDLFKDFLSEDSKFKNLSEEEIKSAEHCPSNNISVERVFGQLDYQLYHSTNKSIRNIESSIMFNNNKTHDWLNSKESTNKNDIIKTAMQENHKYIQNSQKKEKQLYEKRLEKIRQKQQAKAKREDKKLKEKNKLLDNLLHIGIWKNRQLIQKNIEKMRTKKEKNPGFEDSDKYV